MRHFLLQDRLLGKQRQKGMLRRFSCVPSWLVWHPPRGCCISLCEVLAQLWAVVREFSRLAVIHPSLGLPGRVDGIEDKAYVKAVIDFPCILQPPVNEVLDGPCDLPWVYAIWACNESVPVIRDRRGGLLRASLLMSTRSGAHLGLAFVRTLSRRCPFLICDAHLLPQDNNRRELFVDMTANLGITGVLCKVHGVIKCL